MSDTNRYRAMTGRAALARSSAVEAFALEGAREDAASPNPHTHATRTNGGNGTIVAENELHRVSAGAFRTMQRRSRRSTTSRGVRARPGGITRT